MQIVRARINHRERPSTTYAVGLGGEMEGTPLELAESLEEHCDEGVDIFCGVLSCTDMFAVVGVGQANANAVDGFVSRS